MHATPLVGWLLVVVGAATGLSCLLRTAPACAAPPEERRVARAEGLMGLGMALMAVPVSVLDPGRWEPLALAAVFGVATLRALPLARRGTHHLHHAVSAAAMVYMAVVMATAPAAADGTMTGMAGMTGMTGMAGTDGMAADHGASGIALLTGLLMCYFAGYVLWAGVRMVPATCGARAVAVPLVRSPEMVAACRVSMGIGMFAMLALM